MQEKHNASDGADRAPDGAHGSRGWRGRAGSHDHAGRRDGESSGEPAAVAERSHDFEGSSGRVGCDSWEASWKGARPRVSSRNEPGFSGFADFFDVRAAGWTPEPFPVRTCFSAIPPTCGPGGGR